MNNYYGAVLKYIPFFPICFFLHFFPLHPCLSLGFFLTDKLNFSYGPIFLKFWCIVIRNEIYKCLKLVKHLTWEFFHIAWNLPLYFEWRKNWYSHCWNWLCKSNKSLFKRHVCTGICKGDIFVTYLYLNKVVTYDNFWCNEK